MQVACRYSTMIDKKLLFKQHSLLQKQKNMHLYMMAVVATKNVNLLQISKHTMKLMWIEMIPHNR
jgi:hypothetical protein